MNTRINGTCLNMCPYDECVRRENQDLIHILECENTSELFESHFKAVKIPDYMKMVKCFTRSAAGCDLTKPEILRPFPVLYQTTMYLLKQVIVESIVPWSSMYDFVSDRLRSVRQDAVVQQISNRDWLTLLPPMIRFHCYAAHKFVSDELDIDLRLNTNMLTDCFSRLINIYDSLGYHENYNVNERAEMEALYLVLNITDISTFKRYLQIFQHLKNHSTETVFNFYKDFLVNNYVSVLKKTPSLPTLCCFMFTSLHLSQFRSCGNKRMLFPLEKLTQILQFDCDQDTLSECTHYGIIIADDGKAVFVDRSTNIMAKNLALPKCINSLKSIRNKSVLDILFPYDD